MTEPDVALTDFALTLMAVFFIFSVRKLENWPTSTKRSWLLFFAAIALASLTGGITHGFFLDKQSLGHKIFWPITLISIGLSASTSWIVAAFVFSGESLARRIKPLAFLILLIYSAVVLFVFQRFVIAILFYLPAMVALLIVCARQSILKGTRWSSLVASGILISFLAAYVQQFGPGLHPLYFNKNATYHLIQAVGLYLIYKGIRLF